MRSNYNINVVPTNKPTYKARFEFMSKAIFKYVKDDDYEHELDTYEYEYINGIPTEKPVKKDDHYMNATEYCVWGIKQYLDIKF